MLELLSQLRNLMLEQNSLFLILNALLYAILTLAQVHFFLLGKFRAESFYFLFKFSLTNFILFC